MQRDDLIDIIAGHDVAENWASALIDPEDLKRLDSNAYAAYQAETEYRDE